MKKSITGILLFSIALFSLVAFTAVCQQEPILKTPNSSLSPIDPIKGHYKELQKLHLSPNPSKKELDAITYPSKAYGWISFLLRPAYLKKKQLTKMYLQLNLPANSSEQTRAGLDFLLDLQENRTQKQEEEVLAINDIVYIPFFKAGESDLFYICSSVMEPILIQRIIRILGNYYIIS